MVKKFKFWLPHFREIPLILVPPNFVKNYLIFLIVNPKISFVWLKSFEFWRPRLGGTSHFGTPKFGQILFFIFSFVEISCVQLKRLKSLNFGGPYLGETLILEPPFFVRCSLSFISSCPENLIHVARTV